MSTRKVCAVWDCRAGEAGEAGEFSSISKVCEVACIVASARRCVFLLKPALLSMRSIASMAIAELSRHGITSAIFELAVSHWDRLEHRVEVSQYYVADFAGLPH